MIRHVSGTRTTHAVTGSRRVSRESGCGLRRRGCGDEGTRRSLASDSLTALTNPGGLDRFLPVSDRPSPLLRSR